MKFHSKISWAVSILEGVLSQPHFVSLVYKYSVCPFLGVLAEFFALKIF